MAVIITFRKSGAGVVPNGGDYLKGHGGVLEERQGHGGVLEEKDAVNGQSPQRR